MVRRRISVRTFFEPLNHAAKNAAGETRTPMLLPAADFASFYGFRRPQTRPKASPEVWRLDFPFTMSLPTAKKLMAQKRIGQQDCPLPLPLPLVPHSSRRLLGERRQVSTPSRSSALSERARQGLARDWHRFEEGRKTLRSSAKRSPFLTLAHRTVSRAGTHFRSPSLLLLSREQGQERTTSLLRLPIPPQPQPRDNF